MDNRGEAQTIFRVVKPFCVILQWWMHTIVHLSKPIESTPPMVKTNVNYGIWVMRMCHCRVIDCNKHTTLVWGAERRKATVRRRAHIGTLHLLFNFAVIPKL